MPTFSRRWTERPTSAILFGNPYFKRSWGGSPVVFLMLLCALWLILGVLFLHRFRLPRSHFLVCCGVLVLALVLRFLGMGHITSDYTDFLSNWVEFST